MPIPRCPHGRRRATLRELARLRGLKRRMDSARDVSIVRSLHSEYSALWAASHPCAACFGGPRFSSDADPQPPVSIWEARRLLRSGRAGLFHVFRGWIFRKSWVCAFVVRFDPDGEPRQIDILTRSERGAG